MTRSAKVFGKKIRRLLYSGPGLALMEEHQGSWLEGQCWILAEGVLRWITLSNALPPSPASLVILGDAKQPAGHVLVRVHLYWGTECKQLWYLDGVGASTELGLLNYWQKVERMDHPFLTPYDEDKMRNSPIPRDGQMSIRVAKCFYAAFGNFSPTLLDDREDFNGGESRRDTAN